MRRDSDHLTRKPTGLSPLQGRTGDLRTLFGRQRNFTTFSRLLGVLLWHLGKLSLWVASPGSESSHSTLARKSHSVSTTEDWSPRVPATVSSSELSAHHMAPSGVIPH